MVKYYLFRARKIMKEGMYMVREYGEKSYNPDIFNMDYWGTGPNDVYWKLFERRLPGNILLAAYYEPLSITELSLELGVASSWLEDEIKILLEHDLIKLTGSGKYQTNIIIFTPEYEKEVYNATKELYAPVAESLYKFIIEKENEIRSLGFLGSEFSKNRLYWSVITPVLLHAANITEKSEDFPLLSNGSHGYVFGYNRDYSGHNILGIDNANTTSIKPPLFAGVNYRILNNAAGWECYWKYHQTIIEVLVGKVMTKPEQLEKVSELIKHGIISSENENFKLNFPVYTVSQFNNLLEI
jgi:DNA-binding MarR family transcriptional regulator